MSRLKFVRALLLTGVVALAIVPAGAIGAKPERFHERVIEFFEADNVCGLTVDTSVSGVFTDLVFFDKDGNFVKEFGVLGAPSAWASVEPATVSLYPGTSTTATPGWNKKAAFRRSAVWLCRKMCHHRFGTNSRVWPASTIARSVPRCAGQSSFTFI